MTIPINIWNQTKKSIFILYYGYANNILTHPPTIHPPPPILPSNILQGKSKSCNECDCDGIIRKTLPNKKHQPFGFISYSWTSRTDYIFSSSLNKHTRSIMFVHLCLRCVRLLQPTDDDDDDDDCAVSRWRRNNNIWLLEIRKISENTNTHRV